MKSRSKYLAGLSLASVLVVVPAYPALATPPLNDDRATAMTVATVPFEQSIDASEATRAEDDPESCAPTGASLWYRYSSPGDVALEVSTVGSQFDTVVSVYRDSGDSLIQVACSDDHYDLQSLARFDASAGATFLIMVASYGDDPMGALELHILNDPTAVQLDLTFDRNQAMNAANGRPVVTGTLSCAAPVHDVEIGVVVSQGSIVSDGSQTVDCEETTRWIIVLSEPGLGAGPAAIEGVTWFRERTRDFSGTVTLIACTRIGTLGNDVIIGGDGADQICALDGDDQILGHGGNDHVLAGYGNDVVRAGAGDDTAFGGFGNDLLVGESGNDMLRGNEDNDVMNGGDGFDICRGHTGTNRRHNCE